jgi:heptose I phosphotransferase
MLLHRLIHGTRRFWMRPDWPRFAGPDWTQRIMGLCLTDRLHEKQGRSIARWRLDSVPEPVVVFLKRHYRLPRWMGWLALLFPGFAWSPGAQEWQRLQQARNLGVPVPDALAAGEWIGPWGRLQSFLAVAELPNMLPLHEAIPLAAKRLSPHDFSIWKRGLLAEMARLVRLLHDRHWFHKDLYLCHFYIDQNDIRPNMADWKNRVYLIDFHRLARHRWTHVFWQIKDLAQLLYSSGVEGLTEKDRTLFWRIYNCPENHRNYTPSPPESGGEGWGEGGETVALQSLTPLPLSPLPQGGEAGQAEAAVNEERVGTASLRIRWLAAMVRWKAQRYRNHNR